MKVLFTLVFLMLLTPSLADALTWTEEFKDKQFENAEWNCVWLMKEINSHLTGALTHSDKYNSERLLLIERYAGIWHDYCKNNDVKR